MVRRAHLNPSLDGLQVGAGLRVLAPAPCADGLASRFGPDRATLKTGTLNRLFAYGTLMTGLSRRSLLKGAVFEARGRIRGALYDLGEYPALVLEGTGWVHGELYRVPEMAKRLPALDRAEEYHADDEAGSLFLRRRVAVLIGDGSTREAWIYVLNEQGRLPARGPRIPSGDWRAHVATRPALPH